MYVSTVYTCILMVCSMILFCTSALRLLGRFVTREYTTTSSGLLERFILLKSICKQHIYLFI